MPIKNQNQMKYKKIEGEELRLLYTAVLSDIQYTKKQQVEITNYVAGIFIVIVLFFDMIRKEVVFIPYIKLFLSVISVIIMTMGIIYLYKLEKDWQESRNRKDRVIRGFSDGFKDILGFNIRQNSGGKKEADSNFWFFITAICLGELLVLLFLFVG